jgi:uncharacterized protein (DUF983 family)
VARPPPDRSERVEGASPDDWGEAIVVTVVMGAIVIGGLVWTPWVTVFGVIVFWRWVRLLYR